MAGLIAAYYQKPYAYAEYIKPPDALQDSVFVSPESISKCQTGPSIECNKGAVDAISLYAMLHSVTHILQVNGFEGFNPGLNVSDVVHRGPSIETIPC